MPDDKDNPLYANLPPDPGIEGKQTLAGIDLDNDGVRDDIQRWIVITNPDSQKTRMALFQMTKTMQQFLLDSADPVESLSNAKVQMKDADCLQYVQPHRYYKISKEKNAIFFNTEIRRRAWGQADRHLSGKGFSGTKKQYLKRGCHFDPDAMPN